MSRGSGRHSPPGERAKQRKSGDELLTRQRQDRGRECFQEVIIFLAECAFTSEVNGPCLRVCVCSSTGPSALPAVIQKRVGQRGGRQQPAAHPAGHR